MDNLVELELLAHAVEVLLALLRRLLREGGGDLLPVVAVGAQPEPQQLNLCVRPRHLLLLNLGKAIIVVVVVNPISRLMLLLLLTQSPEKIHGTYLLQLIQ